MNFRVWLFCGLLLPLTGRGDVIFTTTNSAWKMLKGLSEASSPDATAWRQPDFEDTSWAAAPAPFYYTSTPTEPPFYNGGPVTGTVLNDMINSYTCLFVRKTFVVTNAAASGTVTVQVAADDGFIVWLTLPFGEEGVNTDPTFRSDQLGQQLDIYAKRRIRRVRGARPDP